MTVERHLPVRDLLIPNGQGAEIAADLYLPQTPGPHPTLVSIYPYRKDDLKGANGAFAMRYLVERGYAHILADLPGLGSSSGISSEAMSYDQAKDGAAVVEWAAAQDWCDGNVGMWGISYGGITSFQTASLRPPHLRAIVPIYATPDPYRDWFYPGGCFNCLAVSTWASQMLSMQLGPPMFQDPAGRWRQIWRERLEQSEPYLLPWQDHPDRDEFWESKAIPIESITAPTFLIGGWRDIFPEGMPRAYEAIKAPRKLWMGPWTHISPDSSRTAPVEYLPEMARWFDRFLRDDRNGIDEEPPVTVYVQGSAGRWRNESEWPIARTAETGLFLAGGGVLSGDRAADEEDLSYAADPSVGTLAGLWEARGTGLGTPLEQSADDLRSLAFTGEPLPASVEITGSPEAAITLAVDEGEDVNLVVKLCDVDPSGASQLITTGWLKLRHRESHATPRAIPVGEYVTATVELWGTSYEVAAGHRLRVSVSCGDFPRIWPTRTNPRIRLLVGGERGSRISIPMVPHGGAGGALPVEADRSIDRAPLTHTASPVWQIEEDLVRDSVTVVSGDHAVLSTPGLDGRVDFALGIRASVARKAPHDANTHCTTQVAMEMPSGETAQLVTESSISLDGFAISGRVTVGDATVFEKSWHR